MTNFMHYTDWQAGSKCDFGFIYFQFCFLQLSVLESVSAVTVVSMPAVSISLLIFPTTVSSAEGLEGPISQQIEGYVLGGRAECNVTTNGYK